MEFIKGKRNKIFVMQTKQQRKNTKEALYKMWPSVPKRNVSENLSQFRDYELEYENRLRIPRYAHLKASCKTIACFGGWVPFWPAFAKQGVIATEAGLPTLRQNTTASTAAVADFLFGDNEMFVARGAHDIDPTFDCHSISDHKLVTRRLKWLLKNSKVVE